MEDELQDDAGDAGDATVVEPALAALDGLDDLPVGDHLAAFEQAHRELRAALEV